MKFCTNCGAEMQDNINVCPKCGAAQPDGNTTQQNNNYGAPQGQPNGGYNQGQPNGGYNQGGYNPQYQPQGGNNGPATKSKVAAGVLGILLGALGIHKFYLGYTKEALIMLLVSLLTCGLVSPVMGVIGLIEGILYLTKSDEEFAQTYEFGHKGWF